MFRLLKNSSRRNPLSEVLESCEVGHFSTAVMQTLQTLRDPESTSDDIARIAQWDAGLVLRVLRMVNSAAYGLRREINSVPQAITFLGRSRLESLVVSLAVKDMLPSTPCSAFDATRFWRTAARRASLARLLAERIHPGESEKYFLYGLLQDMGLPVVAKAMPEQYDTMLGEWLGNDETGLHEIELRTLGWNHAEAGKLLANHWQLPTALAQAISTHHQVEGARPTAVCLVSFVREDNAPTGMEAMIRGAQEHYDLPRPWLDELVDKAEEESAELADVIK